MLELVVKVVKEERLKLSVRIQYFIILLKGSNDKIVKTIVKKVGAQQLGVDEVNFFKDDNTVLHFNRP